MYDETQVQALQSELQGGLEDVRADYGDDFDVDSAAVDLAVGIALTGDWSSDDAIEFFRREFGYVPNQYASLRGVPATDFLDEF